MTTIEKAAQRALDRTQPTWARMEYVKQLGSALRGRGGGEAWTALCRLWSAPTDEIEVRIEAVRALSCAPDAAVNQLVRTTLGDPERRVRSAAVHALRAIGLPPGLTARMREVVVAWDREPSADLLANLPLTFGAAPGVLNILGEAIESDDDPTRALAVVCLTQVGATAASIEALGDPSVEVRVELARSLGLYSTLELREILVVEALAVDPEPSVADAARVARRRLGLTDPRQRTRDARPPVDPSPFAWHDVLGRISLAISEDLVFGPEQSDAAVAAGWLGRPGADPARLLALEERLGRPLPPSYRAFLELTDGFGRISPFIERLRPADEVAPFADENEGWIEAFARFPVDVSEAAHAEFEDGAAHFRWQHLRSCVQVSDVGDSAVILLNPEVVIDGEWEAWFLASWLPGARRYRSFAALLREGVD